MKLSFSLRSSHVFRKNSDKNRCLISSTSCPPLQGGRDLMLCRNDRWDTGSDFFFFSAPDCCLAEPVVTWGTLSNLGALAHSRPSWRHSVENQQVLQESCFQPLALHPHPFLTPAFRTNVPPGASLPFSEL